MGRIIELKMANTVSPMLTFMTKIRSASKGYAEAFVSDEKEKAHF